MAREDQTGADGRVKRVKAQVDRWRSTRKRCSPMPEGLWREATVLAREFGVHRIKCELGLNYEALKKRAQKTGDQDRPGAQAPGFVEWRGAELLGPVRGAVVEVHDAFGGRLTIQMGAGSDLDLAGLVEAFRRHRA